MGERTETRAALVEEDDGIIYNGILPSLEYPQVFMSFYSE